MSFILSDTVIYASRFMLAGHVPPGQRSFELFGDLQDLDGLRDHQAAIHTLGHAESDLGLSGEQLRQAAQAAVATVRDPVERQAPKAMALAPASSFGIKREVCTGQPNSVSGTVLQRQSPQR